MAAIPIGKASIGDILIAKLAKEIFEVLRGTLILTKIGFVDYSSEVKDKGESVKVTKIGDFNVEPQNPDDDVNIQDTEITTDTITLDKYVPVDFIVKDVAEALSGANLIENLSRSAAGAMVQHIETAFGNVFDNTYYPWKGTVTVANGSNVVTGSGTLFTRLHIGAMIRTAAGVEKRVTGIADDTHLAVDSNYAVAENGVPFAVSHSVTFPNTDIFGDTVIRRARKVLVDNKVPEGNRALLCNTDDFDDLIGDPKYISADSINRSLLLDGALGRIRGFSTYESNNFHKPFSVAFSPSAVGIAFRPFKAENQAGVPMKIVTDPVTGIPLRFILTYNPDKRGTRVSIDLLYGVKLFLPEMTVKLVQLP